MVGGLIRSFPNSILPPRQFFFPHATGTLPGKEILPCPMECASLKQ
jgi:hypothetical protein